ncbi:MAG: UvrD-helicase domain-containing protein [Spirochaetes bacterium]|nr:UvrD-helicase domain-containing protein [Spirochaetota bacterium]
MAKTSMQQNNLLNPQQQKAVATLNQYVLILAGAGSGKTHTITSRIVYLINQLNISPQNILAVTFTNKAANEMAERVADKTAAAIKPPLIKTFHSFGAYFLRQFAFAAGRKNNFVIYDEDDSKKILAPILKEKGYPRSELKAIKNWIKQYKQKDEKIDLTNSRDIAYSEMAKIYNQMLLDNNSFDFEDLLLEPLKILKNYPEIAEPFCKRFQYILVDEYQDTNHTQFELLKQICRQNTQLMVVGDEDQSIYRFRGADIQIILQFAQYFPDSEIIRLEQNYRSTPQILHLANQVIKNNQERIGKNLFSQNQQGKNAAVIDALDEREEAAKILYYIDQQQLPYDHTAILFRTNNQSRTFEQLLNQAGIPYIVYGSIGFFDREEIRDTLLLLKWLINPQDKVAFQRFANKPARGLGDKSLEKFFLTAGNYENDLYLALQDILQLTTVPKKAREALFNLSKIFSERDTLLENSSLYEIINHYLIELGLWDYYQKKDSETGTDKIANIKEYLGTIEHLEPGKEQIIQYLEEVSLTAGLNDKKDLSRGIKLMTVHNSKGLEFDHVIIAGLEDGLFPHQNSVVENGSEEEERRLFYVAITRARKTLCFSYCRRRNLFGSWSDSMPSSFFQELDKEYLDLHLLENNIFIKPTDENNPYTNFFFLKKGDKVRHSQYGTGIIMDIKKKHNKHLAMIDFYDYSLKELIIEFSDVEKL